MIDLFLLHHWFLISYIKNASNSFNGAIYCSTIPYAKFNFFWNFNGKVAEEMK